MVRIDPGPVEQPPVDQPADERPDAVVELVGGVRAPSEQPLDGLQIGRRPGAGEGRSSARSNSDAFGALEAPDTAGKTLEATIHSTTAIPAPRIASRHPSIAR